VQLAESRSVFARDERDEDSLHLADNERAALTELYARHAPSVHRFLRDLLGDAALAADATQETFCRAFRRLGSLDDRTRILPWIFAIARNVSLEARKARTRERRVFIAEGDSNGHGARVLPTRTSPEADLLGQESVRIVAAALAELNEERRAALLLHVDHGLSYEDIAQTMAWSLAKVKIEIFRGREVLRATLDAYRRGA
jgi:RNA polymerase sigma-70 factor (ECF subfamily)